MRVSASASVRIPSTVCGKANVADQLCTFAVTLLLVGSLLVRRFIARSQLFFDPRGFTGTLTQVI